MGKHAGNLIELLESTTVTKELINLKTYEYTTERSPVMWNGSYKIVLNQFRFPAANIFVAS